jgi:multidrug efflux pump subunit AcrB
MAGSSALALFRYVPLKMLPFDNKNEFQIVIDMPEGTPLEATNRVFLDFEEYLRGVPEVTNFVSYVGVSSPMDFNGMVRHYYLRQGGHMGDIRVNLQEKTKRTQQSHEIVLRLRSDLEAIAGSTNASIKIVELPPGPPVLATIVAEIYGEPGKSREELSAASSRLRQIMEKEPFVCDIDDTLEKERFRMDFELNKEKAALHGVSAQMLAHTLKTAVSGEKPATIHLPGERQALPVRLVLPREKRSSTASLEEITLKTADGKMIPIGELGVFIPVKEDQPIYHKNLERVVYVFGETAGRAPAEAIVDMQGLLKKEPLPEGIRVEWAGEGEWQITVDVFRDLGIAYMVALLGIYILLVIQMKSFSMPLLIMVAIPLTIIGIMPGFWLFNALIAEPVAGFPNPVFFTATSMIGMIALGGIVIRNSVVLVEFIDDAVEQGSNLKEAVLQSGAIRLRPILLTAATTALGAWPITLDPIFSGLAWALIFGLTASTAFTMLVVPVTYYAIKTAHMRAGTFNSADGNSHLPAGSVSS